MDAVQRPSLVELVLVSPVDTGIRFFRVVDAKLNPSIELVFTDCMEAVECRRVDEEVIDIAIVLLVGVSGRVRVLRFAVEVNFPVYQAASFDLKPE